MTGLVDLSCDIGFGVAVDDVDAAVLVPAG